MLLSQKALTNYSTKTTNTTTNTTRNTTTNLVMMMLYMYRTTHLKIGSEPGSLSTDQSPHLIGYYCLFEQYEKLYFQTCPKYLTKYLSH